MPQRRAAVAQGRRNMSMVNKQHVIIWRLGFNNNDANALNSATVRSLQRKKSPTAGPLTLGVATQTRSIVGLRL